jgi:nitric oxide reductase subunit C
MGFLLIFTRDYLVLLPLRTHSSEITEEVVLGKKVWHKYLCIDCHTLLGNGAYYAPDLTRSWDRFLARAGGDERLAREVMEAFLQNPPQATHVRRGMPRFGMTAEEARGLVSFLGWIDSIDTNGWPPKPLFPVTTTLPPGPLPQGTTSPLVSGALLRKGESLFQSKGCSTCHTLGLGPRVGPDLIDVARRYSQERLTSWIESPDAIYKELGTRPINKGFPPMPDLGLSKEEAQAISAYLSEAGGKGVQPWGS